MKTEESNTSFEEYIIENQERIASMVRLKQEISTSFDGQLGAHGFSLNLSENVIPVTPTDPSKPALAPITEIADIYKFATPYINMPSHATITLGHATNAGSGRATHAVTHKPVGYALKPVADAGQGKLTAIAHAKNYNDFSSAYLEFTTTPLDKDYDKLTILLHYLLDYKLEYTLNQNTTKQFSNQEHKLRITVKEYWAPSSGTGRSLYDREIIKKYEHRYLQPKGPMNFNLSRKPKQHLKQFSIPSPKKGYFYKIILELYAYSWFEKGQGAQQINLVHVPAS